MANRTGVYVDDFLADFNTFPLELHRLLSLIRELDTRSQVLQNDIKDEVLQLLRAAQDANALTPGGGSTATSQTLADGVATGQKRKLEGGEGGGEDAEGSAESSRVKPRLLQYQDGQGEAEGDEDGAAGRGSRLGSGAGGSKGEGSAAKREKGEANGAAGADAAAEALAANQALAAAWATEKVTLSKQACDLLESHVRRLTQELNLFEQDLQQEGKFLAQDDT